MSQKMFRETIPIVLTTVGSNAVYFQSAELINKNGNSSPQVKAGKTITFQADSDYSPYNLIMRRTSGTSGSSTATNLFKISVRGKNILEFSFSYSQLRKTVTITRGMLGLSSAAAAVPAAAAEQSSRYLVKSPMQNGSYTESVRTLTGEQISNYRSRGYLVEGTTRGLQSAITVTGNRNIATLNPYSRRARKGFTTQYMPAKISNYRDGLSQPKSQVYSPRRLFAENIFSEMGYVGTNALYPHVSGTRVYYHHQGKRNMTISLNTARALAARGYKLSLLPPKSVPTRRGSTGLQQQALVTNPYYSNVNTAYVNQIEEQKKREQELLREREKNYAAQQKKLSEKNNLIKQLENQIANAADSSIVRLLQQEIADIQQSSASTIEQINLQNSQNTERLIADFEQKIRLTQEETKKALDSLGAAGASAAAAAGNSLGGITGFFENNQTMIIIGLVVVMMVVMKK